MSTKKKTASRRELAQHLGVSVGSVDKARREGRVAYLPGTKTFDLDVAAEAFRQGRNANMVRTTAPGRTAKPESETDDTSLAEAKRREAIARARLRELELAEQESRLIDATEAQRAWYHVVRVLRDRVLGVPARIASACAAESDARKVGELIDNELRQALTSASDEMPGSVTPNDGDAE